MFVISSNSKVPIYQQLEKNIIQFISFGVYTPDEHLPSVRALAKELQINPNTIQKAYASLESKGVIYTVPGKGAFVSKDKAGVSAVQDVYKENLRNASGSAKQAGITLEEQLKIIQSTFEGDSND